MFLILLVRFVYIMISNYFMFLWVSLSVCMFVVLFHFFFCEKFGLFYLSGCFLEAGFRVGCEGSRGGSERKNMIRIHCMNFQLQNNLPWGKNLPYCQTVLITYGFL